MNCLRCPHDAVIGNYCADHAPILWGGEVRMAGELPGLRARPVALLVQVVSCCCLFLVARLAPMEWGFLALAAHAFVVGYCTCLFLRVPPTHRPERKMAHIRHRDGDPTNNDLDNLDLRYE